MVDNDLKFIIYNKITLQKLRTIRFIRNCSSGGQEKSLRYPCQTAVSLTFEAL